MILKSKIFSSHPELIHGFTARDLGSDYPRIARVLGVDESQFVTVKQIHSNRVVVVSSDHTPTTEADALITDQPGFIIGIRTADCVPLLVYDPSKKVVAAIHAGWRGLVAGIIENTLGEMQEKYQSKISDLLVTIGISLCKKCFEVGPEVAAAFRARFGEACDITPGQGDRSHIGLRTQCASVLLSQGVLPQNVELISGCTSCHNDRLFSYRKGDKEGRQFNFIGILS